MAGGPQPSSASRMKCDASPLRQGSLLLLLLRCCPRLGRSRRVSGQGQWRGRGVLRLTPRRRGPGWRARAATRAAGCGSERHSAMVDGATRPVSERSAEGHGLDVLPRARARDEDPTAPAISRTGMDVGRESRQGMSILSALDAAGQSRCSTLHAPRRHHARPGHIAHHRTATSAST